MARDWQWYNPASIMRSASEEDHERFQQDLAMRELIARLPYNQMTKADEAAHDDKLWGRTGVTEAQRQKNAIDQSQADNQAAHFKLLGDQGERGYLLDKLQGETQGKHYAMIAAQNQAAHDQSKADRDDRLAAQNAALNPDIGHAAADIFHKGNQDAPGSMTWEQAVAIASGKPAGNAPPVNYQDQMRLQGGAVAVQKALGGQSGSTPATPDEFTKAIEGLAQHYATQGFQGDIPLIDSPFNPNTGRGGKGLKTLTIEAATKAKLPPGNVLKRLAEIQKDQMKEQRKPRAAYQGRYSGLLRYFFPDPTTSMYSR